MLVPFHTPPHLRVHLALLVVVSQHCLVLTLGPSAVFVAFFELVLLFLDYAVVTVVLMALVVLAGFLEAGILEFVRQALVHQRVQKRVPLYRCVDTFLTLNFGLKLVVPMRQHDASWFGLEVGCYIRRMSIHT